MEDDVKTNLIDKIFFNKYRCLEYITKGSFSEVYKAEFNNEYYALKLEKRNDKLNTLSNEASMMIYLKSHNIPKIYTYGSSGGYNIIAMQLLGPNLQQMLNIHDVFSLKTVCILAFQMISILEHIHNKGVIHRDIKPENFLLGKENSLNSKYLYLIDFGLAKYFDKNSLNDNLIIKKKLTGTPRYASINALRGIEQSMRDDLESIGYLLIYFLKGKLPWMGIESKDRNEQLKNICIKKIETSSCDLCAGLPKEFVEYIDYCKDLEYGQKPDYTMLKNIFLRILRKIKEKFDYIYDWNEDDKNKIKNFRNYGFYIKSNEIGNITIKTTEDNKQIEVNNLTYKEIYTKNINEDNKKKEEESNKGHNEEQPTTCCFII